MEIAYVSLDAAANEWPNVCKWLDHNCPGWTLAHHHSNKIGNFRTGEGIGYRPTDEVTATLKMTANQAIIMKLFYTDAAIRWSGMAWSTDERVLACEMAEYNGYWREMPAELMGESTYAMIKRRLAEISAAEQRQVRRRA